MINPWTDKFWNVTAQGAFVRQHGIGAAKRLARMAGTYLGGPRPMAVVPPVLKVLIQRRNLTTNLTTIIGGGTSQDGPPS